MTDTHTSPESVERLAARMDVYRIEIDGTEHNPGATLRALSAALLDVSKREAAMMARYDAKLEAAENTLALREDQRLKDA